MNLPFPFNKLTNQNGQEDNELLYSYGHALVSAATQKDPSEIEMRKELDINIHMIEDEGIIKKLDELCNIEVRRAIYNQDGSLAFRKDEHGQLIPVFTVEHVPRPWAIAARIAISKVTATRHITAFDAETYKLLLENTIEEAKENMSPTELSLFGSFLDMVLLYGYQTLDDAIGGQKALTLKMNSRNYEVTLQKPTRTKT